VIDFPVSTYYAAKKSAAVPSQRSRRDADLLPVIRGVLEKSKQCVKSIAPQLAGLLDQEARRRALAREIGRDVPLTLAEDVAGGRGSE
jgi:hypothetical protein